MIIGIDASRATAAQRTGTEAYAYHVIRAIIALAAERGHHLRLYFNQPPRPNLFGAYDHVEQVAIPRQRLWTHSRLRAELQRRPPDVFFTPAHVIPAGYPEASVATVHDLGYEFFPEAHTRRQRAYLRWSTQHNCRRGRYVIADSQATRSDLVRLYGVPEQKVVVAYPGADPDLQRIEDTGVVARTLDKLGIKSPYVVYLGTLQPRKNLVRLVEAYAASGLAESGYALVLAGRTGWLAEPVMRAVAALDPAVRQSVVLPGYVPEDHKAALLTGATALVFPSLYEGFGFPVLEAQACGTAVICSNTSSLPEVAGDAALLVDPLDTAELTSAMRQVADDAGLRARLAAAGVENVRRFTWRQTAVAVLEVLEQARRPAEQKRSNR